MPKINLDWNDLIFDAGQSTTGWAVEMHLRNPDNYSATAIATFTSAAGRILVGQEAPSGATHGIIMAVPYTAMNFAAGTYHLDLVRTDSSKRTDLFQGQIIEWEFFQGPTRIGVA